MKKKFALGDIEFLEPTKRPTLKKEFEEAIEALQVIAYRFEGCSISGGQNRVEDRIRFEFSQAITKRIEEIKGRLHWIKVGETKK